MGSKQKGTTCEEVARNMDDERRTCRKLEAEVGVLNEDASQELIDMYVEHSFVRPILTID